MFKTSTKTKIFSLTALWLFTFLGIAGSYFALKVPTNYSMDQFFPRNHPLFMADKESKKVFQISEATPHILILSLKKGVQSSWYDSAHLQKLEALGEAINGVNGVKNVVSLGNIQSAYETNKQLLVSSLRELQKQGFDIKDILNDPLYTPNLISKNGLHTAVFVMPEELKQDQHKALIAKLTVLARKVLPDAKVQIGGPAAIRTQFIDLLSHEILVFILLSLLCAIVVLKIMFHGYGVLPQMLFILAIANTLALGMMGVFHMSFNVLSSTLPIIVTITALGIASHTLVRMGEAAAKPLHERIAFMKTLLRELVVPHTLTAITTSVGFATLISSRVPMISEYGKVVSAGVLLSALVTLCLIPCLYLWVKWPVPRNFLASSGQYSFFLIRNARWIAPAIGALAVVFAILGSHLSWTAKLFDDLPRQHSASRSTELISRTLGGVVPVDFTIGGKGLNDPWKQPANIAALRKIAREWRHDKRIGSVVTLADFLATGKNKSQLPRHRKSIAELQFLYAMSGDSPIVHFLSPNEKWTRIALRLPDLPADQTQALIGDLRAQLASVFPKMDVRVSGLAATIPAINADISRELMWGFFESLFWIVLVLAIAFRSLRWALVAVIPNLVPPILLMGFLALFNIPIKPGMAIIFSISLGLAFCNTVYVLERLREFLKTRPRQRTLPIYSLMKKETMPCLVSSLSLFAGFSIFLFSAFPVNKLFGVFMLISIGAGLLGDLVWLPVLLRRFPWLLLESEEGIFMNQFKLKWPSAAKVAPYALLIVLGLMAFRSSYAADDINTILKGVQNSTAPPNERVSIKMTIGESDGTKKVRELTIIRKNEGGARALIRLNKPSDLKGLALLTITNSGGEEQYLYLPSDKKSRRILGSGKKGKFLDSEIAYEDLSLSTYKEFENHVVKDDGRIVQVESKAKPNSESSYGRILSWISKPDYRLERVEYFDKKGKVLKRAQFKKYKKIGDKFWRAQSVQVQNVQAKRTTSLIVQKISLNKVADDEVSLSALEE